MACPYFYPVAPRAMAAGPESAILPLGGWWDGLCCAIPGSRCEPEEAALRRSCNLGYARGECRRFPSGDGPDAVRFTIRRDDGAPIRVCYVVERDHHPFAHGIAPASAIPGETLARQAQAYVESYLRRKSEAASAAPSRASK